MCGPSLNKVIHTSPKDALCCSVWLKFAHWFFNVILLFLNYLPFWKGRALHLNETWIPFTQEWFVPSLVKIGPMVPEKILKICQCIFAIISPWKRARPFIWTNLNPFHPKMICAKFAWNWASGSGENFKNLSMYFWYFVIIFPWKRTGLFIWTNLIPLHPKIIWAKSGWNWPSGSGWEDF